MEDVNLNSPVGQPITKEDSKHPDLSADDTPDPRIQIELECLNTSTDIINKLEVDLDEARMQFRQLLIDSTQKIDILAKRLGKSVDQSRPYYEARIKAKQALSESQKAAVRFERAMSQHAAAREMVFLAEEGLMQKGCIFDATWQEMLNHATSKVNDAEREKIESASDHRQTSAAFHEAETRVKSLQKELKRSIAKSSLNARRSLLQMNNLVRMHQLQMLPYFELKASVNHQLENQKQRVKELEDSVAQAKKTYSQALHNLETISDEIHRTRHSQIELGVRGVGVGAEFPGPSHSDVRDISKVSHGQAKMCRPNLHYTSQTSSLPPEDFDNPEEFRSLPSKLSCAAFPMNECPAQGNLDMYEDSEVEAAETSSEFSGWQVVGVANPNLNSSHLYLTVEDRDSILSDTESVASIEMLGDSAIAGLMLEEELAEASAAMSTGTPLTTPCEDNQLTLEPEKKCNDTSPYDCIELLGGSSEERAEELRASLMTLQEEKSQYQNKTEENIARALSRPDTLNLALCVSESDSSPSTETGNTPGYAPLKNTPNSPDSYSGSKSFEMLQ